MNSKKFVLMSLGMSLLLSSCLSNCKTIVKPANPYLQPPVEALKPSIPDGAAQEDPLAKGQWANAKLGLTEVWQNSRYAGVRRVTVAILGSGIDYNHEDLRPNLLVNLREAEPKKPGAKESADGIDDDLNGYVDDITGYDFVESHGLPYDRVGTGTAAAGIIGAVHGNGKGIRGVAGKVSLIPVKYIGANGLATLPDLISALKYAAAAKVDVVYLHLANISFAKPKNAKAKLDIPTVEKRALIEVLGKLASAAVPVIASAGNSGLDLTQSAKTVVKTIAGFPNVSVVTSVDAEDRRPFIANYGKEVVQTSAPGSRILTTLPGNQYGEVTGTFASAAYVAGAVALAIGVHFGQKSPAQILAALIDSQGSDPLPEERQFETLGGNRLNVAKFLRALE